MNTAKLAAALNTISVAFGELAEALTEQPEPERGKPLGGSTPATTAPADAPAGAASPPSPPELPPSFDELPPEDWEQSVRAAIDAVPVRVMRGDGDICPDHDLAWEVVPAGISKRTGKKYTAFFHCPSFGCKQKPSKDWQEEHPAA